MVYPKAVVFDLDGTLVDTAGDLHLILSGLMSEEGLPTPPLAAMRDMVGDGAKVLLARAFASAGVTPDPARLEAIYALVLERGDGPVALGQALDSQQRLGHAGIRWPDGGRCRFRTCDPCRVKTVLYR